MLKWILLLIALPVLAYAGVLLWVFFNQRRLQYFPSHRDAAGNGNETFRPWRNAQGQFIGYLRPVERPKRAVLFFHGNGGEALDREWMAEIVPATDLLLLAEYPGYGARPGKISESDLLHAGENFFEEIRRVWGDLPVTVIGESLGSAVACYVAGRCSAQRLALIAPFPSITEVASHHYRYLPVRWLLKDKYPAAQYVREATLPLHVVHGTQDELVPMALGKKLFADYAGGEKKFSEVPGVGHNQMDFAILHSPFAEEFREFIEK